MLLQLHPSDRPLMLTIHKKSRSHFLGKPGISALCRWVTSVSCMWGQMLWLCAHSLSLSVESNHLPCISLWDLNLRHLVLLLASLAGGGGQVQQW